MGIFTAHIEIKIKIVRIAAERDEIGIDITRRYCDGGFYDDEGSTVRRILKLGEELTL